MVGVAVGVGVAVAGAAVLVGFGVFVGALVFVGTGVGARAPILKLSVFELQLGSLLWKTDTLNRPGKYPGGTLYMPKPSGTAIPDWGPACSPGLRVKVPLLTIILEETVSTVQK